MILLHPGHGFAYEMECVTRLFYPWAKIQVLPTGDEEADDTIVAKLTRSGAMLDLSVKVTLEGVSGWLEERLPAGTADDDTERALGRLLYRQLSDRTGIRPPWGTLTGVRPVRLYRSYLEKGMDYDEVHAFLHENNLVAHEKIRLAQEISGIERDLLDRAKPDGFSLYIGIPFCPSRCSYCSFISHDVRGAAKLIPDYVRLLREELRATGRIARELGLRLQTIYVGGGTPTTLEAETLESVMETVADCFDLSHLQEYTVEAGRPDTITKEKLAVIRKRGAGRISINPQSMQDKVLREIGREHTVGQIVSAMKLAREIGFDCVNMDLIAGLPGDTAAGFSDSVERVLALKPENITVHTLTKKRSSRIRKEGAPGEEKDIDVNEMLARGRELLGNGGYGPYYLYRQKGTLQNLENTGYSLRGKEGLYNVLIMEECQTILSAGAGGVTKLARPGKRLERIFNYKYPFEYISRFDEILRRKQGIKTYYNTTGG